MTGFVAQAFGGPPLVGVRWKTGGNGVERTVRAQSVTTVPTVCNTHDTVIVTTDIMTVEMSARVTKVKEEVEDTKPEFHHPQHDQSDHTNVTIKEEGGLVDNVCHGCGQIIFDKYLMKVGDTSWHSQCLRCHVCHTPLGASHASCFLKYDQVLVICSVVISPRHSNIKTLPKDEKRK